jgi:hypothetical protein
MMLLFIGYGIFSYAVIGSILDLVRKVYHHSLVVSNASYGAGKYSEDAYENEGYPDPENP